MFSAALVKLIFLGSIAGLMENFVLQRCKLQKIVFLCTISSKVRIKWQKYFFLFQQTL